MTAQEEITRQENEIVVLELALQNEGGGWCVCQRAPKGIMVYGHWPDLGGHAAFRLMDLVPNSFFGVEFMSKIGAHNLIGTLQEPTDFLDFSSPARMFLQSRVEEIKRRIRSHRELIRELRFCMKHSTQTK